MVNLLRLQCQTTGADKGESGQLAETTTENKNKTKKWLIAQEGISAGTDNLLRLECETATSPGVNKDKSDQLTEATMSNGH